mmetsp:Transcript_35339/g.79777  ORF Transcript_35339/g.79777 Transcript_35339/m.79777 type:complete len:243 (-) Transcript_35339:60-788(-)|eukprot:CAMPEP_0197906710 /NCGR_PEP_ID=MMETSP1439-20131203/63296_1 /TAXON_ID=66791 /ORGANISM="Gonyaulax spinifera, Strain CCMP409" /LENGTH=242 /DNA_ID=CAMNT_0043528087 /DNA_START=33 /DNA_END=761 /DNA_ORIENTATION=+
MAVRRALTPSLLLGACLGARFLQSRRDSTQDGKGIPLNFFHPLQLLHSASKRAQSNNTAKDPVCPHHKKEAQFSWTSSVSEEGSYMEYRLGPAQSEVVVTTNHSGNGSLSLDHLMMNPAVMFLHFAEPVGPEAFATSNTEIQVFIADMKENINCNLCGKTCVYPNPMPFLPDGSDVLISKETPECPLNDFLEDDVVVSPGMYATMEAMPQHNTHLKMYTAVFREKGKEVFSMNLRMEIDCTV